LVTPHRADKADSPERLADNIRSLNQTHQCEVAIFLPLHLRTRKLVGQQGRELKVKVINPVGYFKMVWLLGHWQLVFTESVGVQREACFFGKTCMTMRDQTEWVELVEAGANKLVGVDHGKIVDAAAQNVGRKVKDTEQLYGGGEASQRIVDELVKGHS
jgi:UDP-GlcNAc3NAcA epimerase